MDIATLWLREGIKQQITSNPDLLANKKGKQINKTNHMIKKKNDENS